MSLGRVGLVMESRLGTAGVALSPGAPAAAGPDNRRGCLGGEAAGGISSVSFATAPTRRLAPLAGPPPCRPVLEHRSGGRGRISISSKRVAFFRGDEMVVHGTVQNGVVVPTDGEPLPEGAAVTIIVRAPSEPANGALRELLLEFAGSIDGLPPDMAEQHDHYLHGRPKK